MTPQLYITRTPDGSDLPLPSYTSKYHIGLNLMAAIGGTIKINPQERLRIPVGFAIGIPQGYCGQIVSHPELAEKNGIIISDAPHILNPADRKPLFVLIQNISDTQCLLHRGDLIAQLVITPAIQVCWPEIQSETQDGITDESNIFLSSEKNTDTEEKKNAFYSFRRQKTSPRNRFKTDNDNE